MALGVGPEMYGVMLATVLLGKLPPNLRLIVGRKTNEAELTLRHLQEIVEEEFTTRERTITPNQGQLRHHSERSSCSMTAASLSGAQGPTCSYCQQRMPLPNPLLSLMLRPEERFLSQVGVALIAFAALM